MSEGVLWYNFWLILAVTIVCVVLRTAWPMFGLVFLQRDNEE